MENLTVIVPMMLFGWAPLTVLFFWTMKPHHAVIAAVLGGWLFLPMYSYDFPGVPGYNKSFVISFGIIAGSILSDSRHHMSAFKLKIYDLPMIIFCFTPLVTSLSNQLGLYDGISGIFDHIMTYGVPYFFGRLYFNTPEALRDLCRGIIIGGVLYAPLCLYEIKMSPQLHLLTYGFFQHSFDQHIRYGGYRPILFMQHGLMVSLWMSISTVMTFWYWRISDNKSQPGISLLFIFIFLTGTTILCKSANGWTVLILGISGYLFYRRSQNTRIISIALIFFPLYLLIRITELIPPQEFLSVAGFLFDEERVSSLAVRLQQEELIRVEALKRPLFGWGEFGRGLPQDRQTGELLVLARDSGWIITFQTYGFLGLLSLYTNLLLGPCLVLRNCKELKKHYSVFIQTLIVALTLVLIFFTLDCLVNNMRSPLYYLISGVLITVYVQLKTEESDSLLVVSDQEV